MIDNIQGKKMQPNLTVSYIYVLYLSFLQDCLSNRLSMWFDKDVFVVSIQNGK